METAKEKKGLVSFLASWWDRHDGDRTRLIGTGLMPRLARKQRGK